MELQKEKYLILLKEPKLNNNNNNNNNINNNSRIIYKNFIGMSILPMNYEINNNINNNPVLSVFQFNTNRVYLGIFSKNIVNCKRKVFDIEQISISELNIGKVIAQPIIYFYSDTFGNQPLKTKIAHKVCLFFLYF